MKKTLACAALAASLLAAGGASATDFNFSYSFITEDPAFPSGHTSAMGVISATSQAGGAYLIDAITGSWNGETITGIVAPGSPTDNDNLIFPDAAIKLDFNGITFSVAGPIKGDQGGGVVTVYHDPSFGYTDNGPSTSLGGTVFNLSRLTASATPEPGAWLLMFGGVGVAGLALRSRRRRTADPLPVSGACA